MNVTIPKRERLERLSVKPFYVGSLFVLVCLLGNFGCGGSGSNVGCTASVDNGIVVVVTDAQTHAPIAAGAVGTIQDGTYKETLRPFTLDASGNVISLAGAAERTGTYTVQITKAGYAPFEKQNVVVTRNVCHVNTVTIAAELNATAVSR